jgi:hypothetical protein
MRNLTNTIRETESSCGKFWIWEQDGRFHLNKRKFVDEPKVKKKNDKLEPNTLWSYLKLGEFDSLELAQKRASSHLNSDDPDLEWL